MLKCTCAVQSLDDTRVEQSSACLVSGEVAQRYHAGLKTRQGLAGMGSNPACFNSFLLKINL